MLVYQNKQWTHYYSCWTFADPFDASKIPALSKQRKDTRDVMPSTAMNTDFLPTLAAAAQFFNQYQGCWALQKILFIYKLLINLKKFLSSSGTAPIFHATPSNSHATQLLLTPKKEKSAPSNALQKALALKPTAPQAQKIMGKKRAANADLKTVHKSKLPKPAHR